MALDKAPDTCIWYFSTEAPATYDVAGFEALTWTPIGELMDSNANNDTTLTDTEEK